MTLENITNLIVSILGGLILIGGVIALVKGWWKSFRKIGKITDRVTLFMDDMFPELLNHMCTTGRFPQDTLVKWTRLIGSENIKSASPMQITQNGQKLVRTISLDKVFEANKDTWADEVMKELTTPASKYDGEEKSIKKAIDLFVSDSTVLNPVKDYLFNNPGKVKSFEVTMLLGLLIRDYLFEKHKNVFAENQQGAVSSPTQ